MKSKETKNSVFIATSLDGFIADKNGEIEWLNIIPEINTVDTGYEVFIAKVDALVMGRISFETVCGFDIEWPYKKPVFVVSKTMKSIPKNLTGKVFLLQGSLSEILGQIHGQGFNRLYIDGGKLIQSFLREDLIDEMIVTIIPVLLGGGTLLFGELKQQLSFECKESKLFLDAVVQNHFIRKRSV